MGQTALELAAEAQSEAAPVFETLDLLVFRAPGDGRADERELCSGPSGDD